MYGVASTIIIQPHNFTVFGCLTPAGAPTDEIAGKLNLGGENIVSSRSVAVLKLRQFSAPNIDFVLAPVDHYNRIQ